MRYRIGFALVLTLLMGVVSVGYTQYVWDQPWRGWGWRRQPPRFPDANASDRSFTFCRVMYESVRREYLGQGWRTDYPTSDINVMTRLSEFTRTPISRDEMGEPNHVVVRLTDEELYNYPFIFMSDVGTVWFDDEEVARLRSYLLRGGFLWVDDFWGVEAWNYWMEQMARVLPPAEYPVVDVPLDHPVFRGLFEVAEIPQVPSIQFWRHQHVRTRLRERGAALSWDRRRTRPADGLHVAQHRHRRRLGARGRGRRVLPSVLDRRVRRRDQRPPLRADPLTDATPTRAPHHWTGHGRVRATSSPGWLRAPIATTMYCFASGSPAAASGTGNM